MSGQTALDRLNDPGPALDALPVRSRQLASIQSIVRINVTYRVGCPHHQQTPQNFPKTCQERAPLLAGMKDVNWILRLSASTGVKLPPSYNQKRWVLVPRNSSTTVAMQIGRFQHCATSWSRVRNVLSMNLFCDFPQPRASKSVQ